MNGILEIFAPVVAFAGFVGACINTRLVYPMIAGACSVTLVVAFSLAYGNVTGLEQMFVFWVIYMVAYVSGWMLGYLVGNAMRHLVSQCHVYWQATVEFVNNLPDWYKTFYAGFVTALGIFMLFLGGVMLENAPVGAFAVFVGGFAFIGLLTVIMVLPPFLVKIEKDNAASNNGS